MQAVIDDNEYLLVRDLTPDGETHYHARFYFDPNGLSMASGDGFQIVLGEMATQPAVTVIWKVHFRKWQGSYRLDAYVRRDDGTWGTPITTQVTDDVHAVEVEWRASSGAGQDDGLLRLWLDGTQIGQILSVDNDTYVMDGARLGVVSPPASTTTGMLCFDAFESRRASYIGLLAGVQGCRGGQGFSAMQGEGGETVEVTGTLAVEDMIVAVTATLPLTEELWLSGTETTELTGTVEVTVTEVLSPTVTSEEEVSTEAALAALLEALPSAPQGVEEQEDGLAASIVTGQLTLVGRLGYEEKEGQGWVLLFPTEVEAAPEDDKLRNFVNLTLRAGQDSDCRYSDAARFWGRVRMALGQGKDASGNYKPSLWLTVKGFTSKKGDETVPRALAKLNKGELATISGRLVYETYEGKGYVNLMASKVEAPQSARPDAAAEEDCPY